VRQEHRNMLKLWSLRIRKDFVTWMAKVQHDVKESIDYVKQVDERGRKCEQHQFDILDVLKHQMRSLEDRFTDLKEQQQKILFGSGESQFAANDEENDIEDDFASDVRSSIQENDRHNSMVATPVS
jgi:hypothetical protein